MSAENEAPEAGGASAGALRARVAASFDRQGLMRHLGAELVSVEPGRVVIGLAARPEITQER